MSEKKDNLKRCKNCQQEVEEKDLLACSYCGQPICELCAEGEDGDLCAGCNEELQEENNR